MCRLIVIKKISSSELKLKKRSKIRLFTELPDLMHDVHGYRINNQMIVDNFYSQIL